MTAKKPRPKILQSGDAVLRAIAEEIPREKIQTPKIRKIIKEMQAAVGARDDAVAIAAPQLGYPVRMFLIAKKIFEHEGSGLQSYAARDYVFINPKITKTSKRRAALEEGCLSVDGLYGMVKRAQKATVRALDERGNPFEWGASGLLAQIFQHEVDHLNGILFTDTATDLHKVNPSDLPSLTS